jgi:hypothetical protein
MKKNSGQAIPEDIVREMMEHLKRNLWLGSGSSTGRNTVRPYNSVTVRGGAGGVSVGPLIARTVRGPSSGTAVSATSSIPPEWVTLKHPTDPYNFKAHLVEPDQEFFVVTLCGHERGGFVEMRKKPHPARMCKTCLRVFKKNVLEGRYAR